MTAVAVRRRLVPPGFRRWLRPLFGAAVTVAILVVLAVYVFPTRTWLDQRTSLTEVSAELDELRAERRALEERVAELDSDEVIEELARSQFGLVRPGEEAYAVLPAPPSPVVVAPIWPFDSPALRPPPDSVSSPDR